MISFILNNTSIRTRESPGMTVLDFVRDHHQLKGTKIGCREGDCGACTVLVGSLEEDEVVYHSMTSCLMPLQNAAGKHIVTIEGINNETGILTPVQQAFVDESGTQCGFCTPGFIVSLTGYCLQKNAPSQADAISAMDGNICRCTGYKSIERAAERVNQLLESSNDQTPLSFAIQEGIVPASFFSIKPLLQKIQNKTSAPSSKGSNVHAAMVVGGGTDLYVQRGEEMPKERNVQYIFNDLSFKEIQEDNGYIEMGGSVTVTDMLESPIMQDLFPNLYPHLKLVSSTPIRNMATIAGNLVNASPIGDMTIWLLALNATIVLKHTAEREIALRDFYQGYKILDKNENEIISKIRFPKPKETSRFNFEKVSKRRYLDIATVNTAIQLQIADGLIVQAHAAAGGVAPVPLYLRKTSAYLVGKKVPKDEDDFTGLFAVLQKDISPISDVRGSEKYKRLLLQQLFRAHFENLFLTT